MSGKTVTRADLCEAVYQKVGLSRTESATLVELVLKEITDCLERGETVKLSSFGSFVVRKKGQRVGRNPKTGKEVPISPRRVMVFKPSAILKQRINSDDPTPIDFEDASEGGAREDKRPASEVLSAPQRTLRRASENKGTGQLYDSSPTSDLEFLSVFAAGRFKLAARGLVAQE
jgi:integration host factor subunit alpha